MESAETKSNWYYAGCYFVCISSVLGTGILALPVKTAASGFVPFFIVLMVVLLMEEAVVIYAVELLQKAHALINNGVTNYSKFKSAKYDVDEDEEKSAHFDDKIYKSNSQGPESSLLGNGRKKPKVMNLHVVGKLFLPRPMRIIFDICVYFHFVSILISYVLAASESWGQVFGIRVNCQNPATEEQQNQLRMIIAGFGFLFTLAIILGQRVFTYVVSAMTAVKGSLLVVMVGIVAFLAFDINQPITNNYKDIADSFLMCTVALGGVVGMMPLIFNGVPQHKSHIRKFRFALVFGMITCAILISLWTFFVMRVVPQEAEPNSPSLTGASENGCISTVPLTEVVRAVRPDLSWIATVVESFIVVSVTVSFVTVGSGLKNFVDAYVDHFVKKMQTSTYRILRHAVLYKILVYVVSFGISISFALGKPRCFLVILEYFSSLTLNLENGLFISYMFVVSASRKQSAPIPLPLPRRTAIVTSYIIGVLFAGAILYDIAIFLKALITHESLC